MEILKKKIILFGFMAVAGVALFAVNMFQNVNSSTTTGFASGLIGVAIIKLITFYRISKDPKLLKKYEIEQKEERFIAIAEKSGRFTFILTLVIEFVAIFMLILIRQNMMATIISTVAGIQTLAYLITFYYLSKKI